MQTKSNTTKAIDNFLRDVWRGLNSSPKYLESKYFYDETGDEIFREIMACPEYYLTKCEHEIFSGSSPEIAKTMLDNLHDFDVVEMGPGDATKSVHLLKELSRRNIHFTYYPIDISEHVITQLKESLPVRVPGIKVHGLNGEYFAMVKELKSSSARNKVVLFLGSNIGNIPLGNTVSFFSALREHLSPGDLVLTGFDIKKAPAIILAAYNDKGGITKRFNMNLLHRINKTLQADIDIAGFEHRPEYNEHTGAARSYLVSLKDQHIHVEGMGTVDLKKGERLLMETSQKYTPEQTDDFAAQAGFIPLQHYYDDRHWFLDALWQVKE